MPESVITDTSVLIALEKLTLLEILCRIYKKVILPEAVVREFGKVGIECYAAKKVESKLIKVLTQDLNLGQGEAEVIALAYESKGKVLIDDLKARKIAEDFGLSVSGSIGLLLKAEKMGLINSALEKVKELKKLGFYVSDGLIKEMAKF
ncbi:MAG: DUF3368 domain-containing protein [Thermodesulfovibrionales bacterium]|nr:DUF3368 domain-containing protein [Thermodesulfovibrionales bacterium]